MYVEVQPTDAFKTNITLDDTCKICLNVTSPIHISDTTRLIDSNHYRLAVTRYCLQCHHYYIDEFDVLETTMVGGYRDIEKIELLKVEAELQLPEIITEDIKELSPTGCKIYAQSLSAELHGYDTLVGIGLRKALEFLLKDFLISQTPSKTKDIQNKLLGKVIDDYITDPVLLSLAKSTSWIGNDETHYTKRHTDRDIQDLKKFLNATIRFISYQLAIIDAQEFSKKS